MNNIILQQVFTETINDCCYNEEINILENILECIDTNNFDNLDENFVNYFVKNYELFEIIKPKGTVTAREYRKVTKNRKNPTHSQLMARRTLNTALKKSANHKFLSEKIQDLYNKKVNKKSKLHKTISAAISAKRLIQQAIPGNKERLEKKRKKYLQKAHDAHVDYKTSDFSNIRSERRRQKKKDLRNKMEKNLLKAEKIRRKRNIVFGK